MKHKTTIEETIETMATASHALTSFTRQAHSHACGRNGCLQILLFGLIKDAVAIEDKIKEIQAALKP